MKVLIAITGIFLFITSKAQLSHNLSLGPDIGVGANFGNSSKLSLGGSIDYVVPIKSKIGLRLHAGYNKFNGKIFDDYVSFLPIRAGIHSLIYQDIFFGLAEAGVVNYKSSNPNSGKTKFSWALGLGYNKYLTASKSQFLQTSVCFNFFKHNDYLNYTWFNFRVAYGFSLGKRKQIKDTE